MSGDEPSSKQPSVFISYAHESEDFDRSVGELAKYLRRCGATVIVDHDHPIKPPPNGGWTPWMQHAIEDSDYVLIVCTKTLKDVFEGRRQMVVRGVTVESKLVISTLRSRLLNNTSIYPILPDGGAHQDIPALLLDYHNNHRFPSRRWAIAQLVDAVPVDMESGVTLAGDIGAPLDAHHRLTLKRLRNPDAAAFVAELAEVLDADAGEPSPSNQNPADRVLARFMAATGGTDGVVERMELLRGGLLRASPESLPPGKREAIEKAAVSLYLTAAFLLVPRPAELTDRTLTPAGRAALSVPTDERIICAIIATAHFGGELHAEPLPGQTLPVPEGTHVIRVPPAEPNWWNAFLRRVYRVVFAGSEKGDRMTESGEPLSRQEVAELTARIRTIRKVRRHSFVLVIPAVPASEEVREQLASFASRHSVPVCQPCDSSDTSTVALLGLDIHDLVAQLKEFWAELPSTRVQAGPSSGWSGRP